MTFIEYCDGKEIFRRRIQHPPKVARTEDFEAWYGTFRDERGLFCGLETKELKNRGLDGTFAESLARCGNPDQFALHINYNGYVYRKATPSEAVNVTVQEVITDNLYDYIHNGEWFQ